ncbi:beta strand repeat-containing protein [Winogradskya humida]|uniref:Calx-beta domain-containing protein n=1 Tax=Winogradskya humida TaxID=113566 RepID=A0ABQ3ZTU0_9ACTN|nr:Calx-beta domain-containing protein [Actinoplanes humidus]GIE21990.1 hypothetical protein Ahu01nite_050920 [Actinoplanes humidus]
MRYSSAHAAKSGSVPFVLRGPKSAKTILAAAVAGVLGLGSVVMLGSPAEADAHGYITVAATTASVTEGGNLVFTVKNTDIASHSVGLVFTGTAANPADFTFSPATPVTVAAGDTATITVATVADTTYEGGNETVILTASVDGSNYGTETGTIVDADAVPTYTLAASPNPVTEAGGAQATITATLNRKSSTATIITLNTVDGTAKSGTDYTTLSAAQLTVPANQISGTATVNITNDNVSDTADIENFTVNSTSAGVIQPANSAGASATVNIKDAQTTPVVTLTGGGSVAEGSTLSFGLSLDHGSEKEITVGWDSVATSPVTTAATPGADFTYPATRTVTIPARQTTSSIAVQTLKDNLNEPDETFDVLLKTPVNATLGTPIQQTGTITQGKDAPKVTIAPASVTEGNTGRSTATFTATLSAASTQTVKVDWKTAADGSGVGYALPGTDFVTKNGTLTFAPGVTSQTFTVEIIGDTIDEGSTNGTQAATDGETLQLQLSQSSGDLSLDLSDPGANRVVKILDDDAAPTLVFADKSLKEGNDTQALLTPVMLSNASDHDITVAVANDTPSATNPATDGPISFNGLTNAPGGNDYTLLNGTVTIAAEQVNGYPVLLINGDTVNEENEIIALKATPTTNNTYLSTGAAVKTAKVTLENDDKVPDLEINSISGAEGTTVAVTGTVTGQRQGYAQVAVTFAGGSSKGSVAATAADFENPGVKVIDIDYGTPNNTVIPVADLKLLTDTVSEPAETIIATGSGIGNTATVTEGIITITSSTGGPSTPPSSGGPSTGPTTPPADNDLTLESAASFRLGVGSLRLNGTAPAAADLTLWGRAVGSDDAADWENLGTTKASASGAFSFSPDFTTTGYWFKVSNGDIESDTIKVNLKEDPDFTVTSTSKGKVNLKVVGDPKVRGLRVRVIRANSDGSWTTVGTGIINAAGQFSKTINGASGKSALFRATIYGDGDVGLLTNTSTSVRVSVK